MQPSSSLDDIRETLGLLDGWEDRYAYLIDLGAGLPPYPDNFRDDAHLVPGCTSRVWMAHRWQDGALDADLDSDSHIVKGLMAVLLAVYAGKTPEQIAGIDIIALFLELGLESHLSPNRRNGFFAVAERFARLAQAARAG